MNTARRTHSFSESRQESPLAHELPYWDFVENVVVLADGTLVKAHRLKGRHIETLDADAVNQITVELRSVLNSLADDTEISLFVDVNSDCLNTVEKHLSHIAGNTAIDEVSQARGELIRSSIGQGTIVRSELLLFVFLRPTKGTDNSKLNFFKGLFASPKSFQDETQEAFRKRMHELEQLSASVSQAFGSAGIESSELDQFAIRNTIYRFLNPGRSTFLTVPTVSKAHREQEFSSAELTVAPELSLSSPREQLACSDLVVDTESFAIGAVHHRIISLKTLPECTNSCLITRLLRLPFHFQLQCHVKVPRQSNELSQLQAKRRMAHSMSVSHGGRATDLNSEAQLNSAEDLLRDLINSGQKILYSQVTVLLRSRCRDELELQARGVLAKFRELNGAEGLCESLAAFPAWKTMLPLGTTKLLRPKRIKTDNLVDLLPVYQDYTGEDVEPVCLFQNRAGNLVAYDPFDSKRLPNFNVLYTGSSGAGKSFMNNLVLLQYMTQRPKVYLIDVGGSYRKLCEFLGGQYIEIAPPSDGSIPTAINPLLLPEGESQPSPQKLKFLLAMLENILAESDGGKLTKLDRSLLEAALIRVYENAKKTPTLSDVASELANSGELELRAFSKILFPWTGNRPYGRMLDQANGIDLKSDFIVFDLKGLAAYPDLQSVVLLIITDFILGNVENPKFRGHRKQIIMDECWELLKSPASSSFMEYCVRTLRKSGSGITFVTQGLDELVASSIGGTIIANCATKFILLQRGDLDPIRRILKLNEQEMELISSLRQKKGVYSEAFMIFNEDRTVVRATPSPMEYWLATSDSLDNAAFANERAVHPDKSLKEVIKLTARKYPYGFANGEVEREVA